MCRCSDFIAIDFFDHAFAYASHPSTAKSDAVVATAAQPSSVSPITNDDEVVNPCFSFLPFITPVSSCVSQFHLIPL